MRAPYESAAVLLLPALAIVVGVFWLRDLWPRDQIPALFTLGGLYCVIAVPTGVVCLLAGLVTPNNVAAPPDDTSP